jgi:hypothetical protein
MAENWNCLTHFQEVSHIKFEENLSNGIGADTRLQTDKHELDLMNSSFYYVKNRDVHLLPALLLGQIFPLSSYLLLGKPYVYIYDEV